MLASERPRRIQWALAAGMLGAYLACQEEDPRPGAIGDCTEDCVDVPDTPRGPGVVSPGAGGSAGAGGGGNAGSAGSSGLPLSGSIQAVTSPALASRALDGPVKVRAAGASAQQVTVDAARDGTFRLEGVNRSTSLWVGVGPFNNDPASLYVDTLQVVSSAAAAPVALLAMKRLTLETLASTSFPDVELDTTAAQVILRFVDQQREAISGVTLSFPSPEDVAVAYDAGEIYSEQTTETAERGTLVLLNLASSAYPGISTTVEAEVQGMRRSVELHTASGAVTIVTAVMP